MDLPWGEPECGPWDESTPATVLDALLTAAPSELGASRAVVIGIDGRGGSGKTMIAQALAAVAAERAMTTDVVHTDDVAWHHSFFGWSDMLTEHVLAPIRRGQDVSFRPPAWVERGRPGAVIASAGSALVIVEGSGVARRSLAPLLDATVWVQVDTRVAAARLRARDGTSADTLALDHEWTRDEEPFMRQERPWTRCTTVVNTTIDGRIRVGRSRSR